MKILKAVPDKFDGLYPNLNATSIIFSSLSLNIIAASVNFPSESVVSDRIEIKLLTINKNIRITELLSSRDFTVKKCFKIINHIVKRLDNIYFDSPFLSVYSSIEKQLFPLPYNICTSFIGFIS